MLDDNSAARLRLLIAHSSIAPIELYTKSEESRTTSAKILASWVVFLSVDPEPSVSSKKTCMSLEGTYTGLPQIQIP